METNTKFIQIRGKLEVEQDYKKGQDLRVLVTVTDVNDHDNDDGTCDLTYKCRLFEVLDEN